MTASTKRPLYPALIRNAPSCPVCYVTVVGDGDRWRCERCHVQWESDRDDDEGVPDGAHPQCPAEVEPYLNIRDVPHLQGARYRCVRDAGHPTGPFERHVGARSGGGFDQGGGFDWHEGEFPQASRAQPADVAAVLERHGALRSTT